jgi:predicted PurR-regulated permease PerM
MTDTYRERRLIIFGVFALIAGLLLVYTLYLVRAVLMILYVAGLLAMGLSPIVRWLELHLGRRKRRFPRWLAIGIIYAGLVLGATLMAIIVIGPFVSQVRGLWSTLPGYIDQFQDTLVRHGLITHNYKLSELLKNAPDPMVALGGIVGALQGAAGIVGALATVLILPYYLLIESDWMHAAFIQLFARERRPQIARLSRDVTIKVGAWLSGQMLLSLIIGSTAALGLWLLGVPYFYVLALICAIGELIPVIGPILAAIPAVLVALMASPQTSIWVIVYFTAQQFIENHFLVPRVMERQVGLSSVTVIAALLIGTELLGIVGALLAVPTAAIIQVLLQEYVASDRPAE